MAPSKKKNSQGWKYKQTKRKQQQQQQQKNNFQSLNKMGQAQSKNQSKNQSKKNRGQLNVPVKELTPEALFRNVKMLCKKEQRYKERKAASQENNHNEEDKPEEENEDNKIEKEKEAAKLEGVHCYLCGIKFFTPQDYQTHQRDALHMELLELSLKRNDYLSKVLRSHSQYMTERENAKLLKETPDADTTMCTPCNVNYVDGEDASHNLSMHHHTVLDFVRRRCITCEKPMNGPKSVGHNYSLEHIWEMIKAEKKYDRIAATLDDRLNIMENIQSSCEKTDSTCKILRDIRNKYSDCLLIEEGAEYNPSNPVGVGMVVPAVYSYCLVCKSTSRSSVRLKDGSMGPELHCLSYQHYQQVAKFMRENEEELMSQEKILKEKYPDPPDVEMEEDATVEEEEYEVEQSLSWDDMKAKDDDIISVQVPRETATQIINKKPEKEIVEEPKLKGCDFESCTTEFSPLLGHQNCARHSDCVVDYVYYPSRCKYCKVYVDQLRDEDVTKALSASTSLKRWHKKVKRIQHYRKLGPLPDGEPEVMELITKCARGEFVKSGAPANDASQEPQKAADVSTLLVSKVQKKDKGVAEDQLEEDETMNVDDQVEEGDEEAEDGVEEVDEEEAEDGAEEIDEEEAEDEEAEVADEEAEVADEEEQMETEDTSPSVAIIGDSWVQNFPTKLLPEEWEVSTYGWKAASAKAYLVKEDVQSVIEDEPTVAVLHLGANDICKKYSVESICCDIADIVKSLEEANIMTFVCELPPRTSPAKFNKQVYETTRLAVNEELPKKFSESHIIHMPELKGHLIKGVELKAEGYNKFADAIREAIENRHSSK